MWLKLTKNYSPNFDISKRGKKDIQLIIIHYTGMRKESLAIERLCNSNSKVSAHYLIKKNGEIIVLVPDLYVSWHAGISSWKKFKSINKSSIGIEIQNPGHDHNYENFSFNQIRSLKKLLKYLVKIYKIDFKNILGHSDVAPARKKDPGEKFPWKSLSKVKLGLWHNLQEVELKKIRLLSLDSKEETVFLKNLCKLGYNRIKPFKSDFNNRSLIKAFQRRFRQNLINGLADKECLAISKNLIKP